MGDLSRKRHQKLNANKMSIKDIINFLKGKKTYFLAVISIIYGIAYKDPNAVMVGLVACGLRSGMATEVAKLATNP